MNEAQTAEPVAVRYDNYGFQQGIETARLALSRLGKLNSGSRKLGANALQSGYLARFENIHPDMPVWSSTVAQQQLFLANKRLEQMPRNSPELPQIVALFYLGVARAANALYNPSLDAPFHGSRDDFMQAHHVFDGLAQEVLAVSK